MKSIQKHHPPADPPSPHKASHRERASSGAEQNTHLDLNRERTGKERKEMSGGEEEEEEVR